MADTSVATGLTVQQWDDNAFREYLGWNKFARYQGMSPNSIIQVKEDLTKKKGDSITFALLNRLSNAGVSGSNTLEGNEEEIVSRSHKVTVDQIRNAVRIPMLDEQFSAISLRQNAGPLLQDWAMENLRDRVIEAMHSINGTNFSDADATARDLYITDNNDRNLFGAVKGNYSAGDHSASLDAIDNTADQLSTGMISLAKRMAKEASPRIRPIRVREAGDEEWYVLFCNTRCFRDLQTDTALQQANREARVRGVDNPLFTGGDLIWDGVIIREVEEIPVYQNGAPIDVAPNFLCGAQAIGFGIAKRLNTVGDNFDYEDKAGLAIRQTDAVEKLRFGSGTGDTDDLKDHGVLTIWAAAVADA